MDSPMAKEVFALKKVISLLLVLLLIVPAASLGQSTGAAFQTVPFESEGFVRIINPNNGPTLSYSPQSGVSLLSIEDGGYTYAFKDLNRNGQLDEYEDWRLSPEDRAAALTEMLPLENKAGLMVVSFQVRTDEGGEISEEVKSIVLDEKIRTLLIRNSANFDDKVKWYNSLQAMVEADDEFGIPVTLTTDPKNGSAGSAEDAAHSMTSASGWPSSLALAATFDPAQALLMGQVIAREYRALGISSGLSPQIDLATEPRWSRFSGTYGESSALSAAFARAIVSGMQSSWDGFGADAQDLGWGEDSVVAMIKHFPGDGAAEAGREAHNNYGKYNVYPGQNMAEHIEVFKAALTLDTLTGSAAAVMPSYSMAYDAFGPIGEAMGSAFSAYKLKTILREQLGFKGLICADWEITENKPWGIETQGYIEKYVTALKNGLNQFGGLYFSDTLVNAFEAGARMLSKRELVYPSFTREAGTIRQGINGEQVMSDIYDESVYLVLYNHFLLGLFENPYISHDESLTTLTSEQYAQMGYDAQLASIVLLKNKGNAIAAASGEKQTVYIPIEINTGVVSAAVGNDTLAAHNSGDWSLIGYEQLTFDGALAYSFDPVLASQYFNIVTDMLSPDADLSNITEQDIIRRTDFSGVDFALVSVSAPRNSAGYESARVNLDPGNGALDNGYYPISLIYNDYLADPAVVREYPIAVDPNEEVEWTAAGGQRGRSRYYGGKTTLGQNMADLNLMETTRETIGDLPMVVYISASNPFCAYEFEPFTDAILVGMGISANAALDVISGKHEPSGLLPMQLPADMSTVERQMEDVPFDMECHVDTEGNRYDFAFGLDWSGVIQDTRVTAYR